MEKEALDKLFESGWIPEHLSCLRPALLEGAHERCHISLEEVPAAPFQCSVVYRNLGFAYAFRKNDPVTARQYYWEALRRDPGNGIAAQELLSICSVKPTRCC